MANSNGLLPLMNGNDHTSSSSSSSLTQDAVPNDLKSAEACDQLMQRIRRRQNAKSWNELIKISRLSLQEKRHSLVVDAVDRSQLQKCLDTMQKSIKVTSFQSMVERLETITRQLGLKFTFGPNDQVVFISSGFFYIEVVLEAGTGYVLDVKIAHHDDPISCPELTRVLREADFAEFHRHLDGLSAIYQLNTDKKQKIKAYLALHALEADLSLLAQIQSSINDPNNLIHKTPVGILIPRRGGHPMQLTYFISPYELLDANGGSLPLSVDVVSSRRLGYHVKVCIEPTSTSHKLQTTSLLSITKTLEGRSLPQFAALNSNNSCSLPACFVLRLPQSLPISLETLAEIRAITGIDIPPSDSSQSPQPLLELIAKQQLAQSNNVDSTNTSSPYMIQLPDQAHAYYASVDSNSCCWTQQEAIEINCIPFDHPTCVAQILSHLRQQVLFNVLIGSCIRRSSSSLKSALKEVKQEQLHMFEISAASISSISVSFEHPVEQSLATIDFDLKDITSVRARLYDSNRFADFCSDDFASKVMQRCFSIPITMRSIIKRCQSKAAQLKNEKQKNELTNGSSYHTSNEMLYTPIVSDQSISGNGISFHSQISNDTSQTNLSGSALDNGGAFLTSGFATKNVNSVQHGSVQTNIPMQQQQQYHQQQQQQQQQQQMVHHSNNYGVNMMQQQSGVQANLQNKMQHHQMQQQQQQSAKSSNAMLMTMLSDVPAANSQQFSSYSFQGQNASFQQSGQMNAVGSVKIKKPRKRKGTNGSSGMSPGGGSDMNMRTMGGNILCSPSPKRKAPDDEFNRELSNTPNNPDLIDSSVGFDSFSGSGGQMSRPPSTASSMLKCEPGSESVSIGQPLSAQFGQTINSQPMNQQPHAIQMSQMQHFQQQQSAQHQSAHHQQSHIQFNHVDNGNNPNGSSNSSTTTVGNSLQEMNSIQSFAPKNAANFLDNSTFDFKRKSPTVEAELSGSAAISSRARLLSSSSITSSLAQGSELNSNVLSINNEQSQLPTISNSTSDRRLFANSVDGLPRKDRKRKRLDSSNMLMPPPTSSGIVPSGLNSSSAASISNDSNDQSSGGIGSPALRPITLNVKPVGSSNLVMSNNAGNKSADRNMMMKSKIPSPSPKSNDSSDSNSSTNSSSSPRSSPKLSSKQSKNKTLSAILTNQPKVKNVQSIGSNIPFGKSIAGISFPSNVSQSANVMMTTAFSASSSMHTTQSMGTSSSSNSPLSASPSMSPVSPNLKSSNITKPSQLVKKSKGSLSAVIDKLRVTASTGGEDSSHSSSSQMSDGSKSLQTNSSNTPTSGQLSSVPSPVGVNSNAANKPNFQGDSKLKHTRPEFTVKQSSGGTLKLTVTKTKGQAAISSNSSNLSHSGKLVSKTSSGIKRQWQSGGHFKNGQLSQKQQQQQQRPLSPESADQILEAALPKIQLDKLPKIPKTASSQNNANNQSTSSASGVSSSISVSSSSGTTSTSNSSSLMTSKANSTLNKYNMMNKHQSSLRQQLQHNLMPPTSTGVMSSLAGALMPPPAGSSHYRKFGPRELPLPHLPPPSSSSSIASHSSAFPPVSSSSEQHSPFHLSSSSSHSSHSSSNALSSTAGSRLERIFASKMDSLTNTNDPRLLPKTTEPTTTNVTNPVSTLVMTSSTPSSPMESGSSTEINPKTPPLIPTERLSLEESSDTLKSESPVATKTFATSDSKPTPKSSISEDADEEERLLIDVPGVSSAFKETSTFKTKSNLFESQATSKNLSDRSESTSLSSFNLNTTSQADQSSCASNTGSPSSNPTSSTWKRSPCVIDDDLMDEALIGTAD